MRPFLNYAVGCYCKNMNLMVQVRTMLYIRCYLYIWSGLLEYMVLLLTARGEEPSWVAVDSGAIAEATMYEVSVMRHLLLIM